jgi:hypothetical protein
MPKLEVETKLGKGDECYFLLWGAICKGVVKQINIYIAENRDNVEEDADEGLIDITPLSEDVDLEKPMVEYYVKVDHPLLNDKHFRLQRFTQGRVFNNPRSLIVAIQNKFRKTYETSI